MWKIIVFSAVIVCILGFSWFENSYDDCILNNIKSSMSNSAAVLVAKACRNKYPLPEKIENQPSCHIEDLTREEMSNIKLQGDSSAYSIWNGNPFTVIELALNVKYKADGFSPQPQENKESNVSIIPLVFMEIHLTWLAYILLIFREMYTIIL